MAARVHQAVDRGEGRAGLLADRQAIQLRPHRDPIGHLRSDPQHQAGTGDRDRPLR